MLSSWFCLPRKLPHYRWAINDVGIPYQCMTALRYYRDITTILHWGDHKTLSHWSQAQILQHHNMGVLRLHWMLPLSNKSYRLLSNNVYAGTFASFLSYIREKSNSKFLKTEILVGGWNKFSWKRKLVVLEERFTLDICSLLLHTFSGWLLSLEWEIIQ